MRNVTSNSSITSLNTWLSKTAATFNKNDSQSDLAPIEKIASYHGSESAVDDRYRFIGEKLASYLPTSDYQQHALHYVLKGIGYLPDPLLENLVGRLKGPTSKQYLHADAHMRLIIAVNSKLKTPLHVDKMQELRQRFAADSVAMQAPKVWQQEDVTKSNIKRFIKKDDIAVNWQDKTIANADDGDMTVRCYQATAGNKTQAKINPDETVMLFFHGGGFCIGDVDTHHEFCHAVCEQTGWPVVSVDYRLSPEYSAPVALRDCITAYAWLADNCQSLGASAKRIVLAGDSAGGGLSTLVAQQVMTPVQSAWADLGAEGQKTFELLKDLPAPLAQMPLYPVTDVETDYPSWDLYGEGLLLDHADVAVFDAACLANSPLSRDHVLISPMIGDNSRVCPTYVVASELDVLRDEAFAYAKQLESFGIATQTYTVLGAPHGFIHLMSVHQGIAKETHDIIKGFAQFVSEVISTQAKLAA
ncbi:alpha/beta hydrolase [Psychrobacter sp. T6-1]|uniref:alpha/beta hydrolase n=1 Tax=Psychrobacter sp. T6-1 TaxID=3457447 RepID=UPI003FD13C0A